MNSCPFLRVGSRWSSKCSCEPPTPLNDAQPWGSLPPTSNGELTAGKDRPLSIFFAFAGGFALGALPLAAENWLAASLIFLVAFAYFWSILK